MSDSLLGGEDIKSLIANPTTENKVKLIEKITHDYTENSFEDKSQLSLVEDIFRDLIKGAEIEVRKALSENIISSTAIPKDVVMSLAEDVNEISAPILEFSDVLDDDDILKIIQSTQDSDKHEAIAHRASLSEGVSDALIDVNNHSVTESLLENEGAAITQKGYEKVAESFSDDETVIDSLIRRGDLSHDVVARVTRTVSENIQKKLEIKHGTSFGEINSLFENTSELAAMKLMTELKVDSRLIEIVNRLSNEGSLDAAMEPPGNPNLVRPLDNMLSQGPLTVLSTLAMGNLELFILGVARRAKVKPSHVMTLLRDEKGFNAIYQRADLSEKMRDVTRFAMEVAYKMNEEHDQGYGHKAKEDVMRYMRFLQNEAQGKRVKLLSHFISIVKHHITHNPVTNMDQSKGW